MQDFKKLKVWDKAHCFVRTLYGVTTKFPKEEIYGLTSQLRRSGVSIPANIAEGCGKGGKKEFSRYLTIAFGSACETEYYLILACDLAYISHEAYVEYEKDIQEIKKMLAALLSKLTTDN